MTERGTLPYACCPNRVNAVADSGIDGRAMAEVVVGYATAPISTPAGYQLSSLCTVEPGNDELRCLIGHSGFHIQAVCRHVVSI